MVTRWIIALKLNLNVIIYKAGHWQLHLCALSAFYRDVYTYTLFVTDV